MAFSDLSNADLKTLKHHFQDWCQRKRKDFSLLITGKSGVGKSSLVNALVGKKVAEEGRRQRECASEVTSYCTVSEGITVRLYDSPGLQDGKGNEESYLADIKQKITKELDLVIFCIRMDNTRFYPEDRKTMQILTDAFGKKLWEHAVIALTFANKVEDPAGGDKKAFYLKELEFWQETIHSFFIDDLEIDSKLPQYLPLVPTGYYQQPYGLPNCENWLSSFWLACFGSAKRSAFNLHALPSSGGDDSEIPFMIESGEKEEDSYLKKTWDMFKKQWLKFVVLLGAIGAVGFTVRKLIK